MGVHALGAASSLLTTRSARSGRSIVDCWANEGHLKWCCHTRANTPNLRIPGTLDRRYPTMIYRFSDLSLHRRHRDRSGRSVL